MTSLTTLPLDVLQHIFQELTVQDVLRTGMTCKALRNATNDHHVWLPRAKEYRAQVPSLKAYEKPITAFSTQELKVQAIREARLASRWRSLTTETQTFASFTEPNQIYDAFLLPGGNYVVVVHVDGSICLRTIEKLADDGPNPYRMAIVAENDDILQGLEMVSIEQVEGMHTLEHGMLLSLTLANKDDPQERVGLQLFHVDISNLSITTLRSVQVKNSSNILSTCTQGDVWACLYGCRPTLYILIASVRHSLAVHLVPERTSGLAGCDLCMPSPHTLVIYGNSTIHIYHVPDIDLSASGDSSINIVPTWVWTGGPEGKGFRPNITIWDESRKEPPTIHLVSDTIMHVLAFKFTDSRTRLAVTSHRIIPIDMSPLGNETHLTLKCRKGVWQYMNVNSFSLNCVTMSLDDPTVFGCLQLDSKDPQIPEDMIFEVLEFDEVSGRVIILSSLYSEEFYMHIADVI